MEDRGLHESRLIISAKDPLSKDEPLSVSLSYSTRGKNGDFISIFPLELFEQIADHLFALIPPRIYNESIHSSKPEFATVYGFMAASPALHDMGMIRWVRLLTIRNTKDWEIVLRRPHLVQELICLDGVFGSEHQCVLDQFPYLDSASINVHSDVYKNASGRFSYRDVFCSLPAGVTRLEIIGAHGPDLKMIEMVRDRCPNIEVLRLGRCTMFNRTPACEFWVGFPFDHDAYIALDGTDDYAHSVAQEMISLTRLKHIRLGVYLAPSTTVLAHRAYHTRKQPAPVPINWQQALVDSASQHGTNGPPEPSHLVEFYHRTPTSEADFGPDSCTFCRDGFYDQSKNSESSASAVMKTVVPSLERVEWMDWFTPSHLGVSQYDVKSSHPAPNS